MKNILAEDWESRQRGGARPKKTPQSSIVGLKVTTCNLAFFGVTLSAD
jgi:hypothetical protein